MQEIWKEIEGYNGYYQISTYGRVKSIPRKVKFGKNYRYTKAKILKPRKHTGGYLAVCLDHKNQYIHRLVANAFIDNPNKFPQINHKDENKENNFAENLEWCDAKYNCNYGDHTEKLITSRNKNYKTKNLDTGEIYDSPLDASQKTGIHNDSISRVCRTNKGKAGGYRWQYIK